MIVPRSWWWSSAATLFLAALLPIAAHWIRQSTDGGCALDGNTIEPSLRVRIVCDDKTERSFCSLACAELWMEAEGRRPPEIYVTDESTGRELPADRAFFVRSRIMSNMMVREVRHVFASQDDAAEHARRFHGRVLSESQRPFVHPKLPKLQIITTEG